MRPENPPLFYAWDSDRGDEPITTEVTLRDLFAAAAIAYTATSPGGAAGIARSAYDVADAMLAERERRAERDEEPT